MSADAIVKDQVRLGYNISQRTAEVKTIIRIVDRARPVLPGKRPPPDIVGKRREKKNMTV